METTLYDKAGQPTAYVAVDKETICLWSGKAAAYIDGDKLYGFNGRHLGWTKNGIFYTQDGARVGFRSDKCPAARHTSPVKCIKQEKKARACARYRGYGQYCNSASPKKASQSSSQKASKLELLLLSQRPPPLILSSQKPIDPPL